MFSLSLVDTGTGDAIWGEQYDRKMQDLSVLRNDIARDVAQKLRTRLSNSDTTNLTKNYTANAEALRLQYLLCGAAQNRHLIKVAGIDPAADTIRHVKKIPIA